MTLVCTCHLRLTKGKMGANWFLVLSTFLVLMFGFTLSLPTVDDGDSEHGKYVFQHLHSDDVLSDLEILYQIQLIWFCFCLQISL